MSWLGDALGDAWGSLFGGPGTTYGTPTQVAGVGGGITPTPPGGYGGAGSLGGLLDPRGIREQAFYSGLGALSQGLLAAGLRHPAAQGSLIPQALAGFQPAYNAGIQSGGQMAALEQQAIDQQRMEQLRRSDPRYANLPTQALIAQASRPQGRPMTDAEIATRRLTPGLPWEMDQYGNATIPAHDPRVLEAGSAATARGDVGVRGVDLGFTGVRGYPNVSAPPPVGGAVQGPTVAAPGGRPSPAPGPGPGGARPQLPPTPQDRARMEAQGIDPDAYIGGPHDPNHWEPGQPPYVPPVAVPPAVAAPAAPPQTAQAPATPPAVRSTDPQMRTVPNYGRVFGSDPAAVARARGTAETQDAYTRATIIPQINNGVQTIEVVRRMREQAADPNMQFGPGAGARNTAAEFLRSWGGESGAALATRIQSTGFSGLESLSAQQVLASLGGSLGSGISNTDVAFINRTVPNPFQSRETFTRFVDLVESRAMNNIRTAHNAYRGTVPDWNATSDPISAHMIERLEALGVDTAPLLAQRQRGATPPAARPPAATSPPAARTPQRGDTATNPQTGARMEFDGIRWNLLPPTR
jgi:hypothetical protein